MTRYFDSPGEANTDEAIELAVGRAAERGIEHIVIASSTGKTGVKCAEAAAKKGIKTIVVTYHYGFSKKGEWTIQNKYLEKLRQMEVPIISASHALSGVERSMTKKLGGPSRVEVIAEALRGLFGQGMKVCVEITLMAADAGAIPCGSGKEVIAIGGSAKGSDTAVMFEPSHSNSFFDLSVREIIAMPRSR
ncbi:MAG TPA: hypothetical protein ENN25_05495 [Euryarchaeota archaeon]|nr:hypothetical protein [Euryarchaeota archaeon]